MTFTTSVRRLRAAYAARHPRRDESGVALIMTLLLLALLLVLVLDLAYDARINLRLVTNHRDDDQMHYAIRGEIEKVRAILRYDFQDGDVDSTQDEWAQSGLAETYNDVNVSVRIEDESRKFNLLWLVEPDMEQEKKAKKRKREDRDIDEETGADKTTTGKPDENLKKKRERANEMLVTLIDEFRQNTEHDLSESDARAYARAIADYLNRGSKGSSSSIPRAPTTDGSPITVDEVLLAPGVDEDLLYDFYDEETGEIVPGLQNYVTIWSDGAININTACENVLRILFDEKDRDKARDLAEYRMKEPEDEEAKKELEKKQRQTERKKRERREEDERRLGRSLPDRPDDEEMEEYDPGKTPAATQVFEGPADLKKDNLLDDAAIKQIEPWISTSSTVFSAYITASRGTSERRVRVVLRRDAEGEVTPILFETRRDVRYYAGEKSREERLLEAEENGEGLFGGDDELFGR